MKKEIPTLEIGSNGYCFINGFHCTEEEFYREKASQQLDRIEEKIDLINKNLTPQ